MLKFQHDDVIISDVSEDFAIFFGMGNRLAISYLSSKFCCDTTFIACNTCIFMYIFCIFPEIDRGFSIMTSLSMTSQSPSGTRDFQMVSHALSPVVLILKGPYAGSYQDLAGLA